MRLHEADGNEPLIRHTHPNGYRSGEWARITGVTRIYDRVCFEVEFIDGATDFWPVQDQGYEFH